MTRTRTNSDTNTTKSAPLGARAPCLLLWAGVVVGVVVSAITSGCTGLGLSFGVDHGGEASSQGVVMWDAVLPLRQALSCGGQDTARSWDSDSLHAELWIGGYTQGCDVQIDADTGAIDGSCQQIIPGVIRPLLLRYALQPSSGVAVPVAFVVGSVDLRPRTIDKGTEEVAVNLTGDGQSSVLLRTPAEVDAQVPDNGATGVGSLFEALSWARNVLLTAANNLDGDDDGCPNYREACRDTLFADESTACP